MAVSLKKLAESMSVPDKRALGDFLTISSRKVGSTTEVEAQLELSLLLAIRRLRGQI